MAVNYASKYSSKVDERFTRASITEAAVNQEYDFVGVNAVNVFSIATAALNNYTMTGTSRYGTPAELQDTVQTLALSQDKGFAFTLDKRNAEDSAGAKQAGVALRRQVDEVIIPTIDKYRLSKMVAGAGTVATAAAITSANAYDKFLDGQNALLENGVPMSGRIAFVSPTMYKALKLDPAFMKASDVTSEMLVTGSLGMVDGVNIIPTPASYLPANVEFVLVHPIATCAPQKLADYTLHQNPPGINGDLVEGRLYYDAFVLANKAKAIYVHSKPAA